MDRLTALVGLVLLSPLLLVLIIINRMLGVPAFFKHPRPGKDEKVFELYKVCTIHPETGEIRRYSQLLRHTSLDELPQLWNILKGDMSFVGPRPLLIEYLTGFTSDQRRRHQVLPGVTGWAQVHGRNTLSLEEKVGYDLEYVDQVSWYMDLKIILRTILQVFKFDQADGHNKADTKRSVT